jgi:hypothetical protein
MQCPPCKGSGIAPGQSYTDCKLCKGEGILPDTRIHLPACHACKGSGIEPGHYYTLCKKCGGWGRRERKPAIDDGEIVGPTALMIEAGTPRTAHLEVSSLLNSLTGDIRICDPYYGKGSMNRLDEIRSCTSVKFLTHTPDSREKLILPTAIAEFVRERPEFVFRKYKGNDLHDRFILSADELMIVGHGLKDLGNKESFVIRLDRSLAGDLIDSVRQSFDQKWANTDPL